MALPTRNYAIDISTQVLVPNLIVQRCFFPVIGEQLVFLPILHLLIIKEVAIVKLILIYFVVIVETFFSDCIQFVDVFYADRVCSNRVPLRASF